MTDCCRHTKFCMAHMYLIMRWRSISILHCGHCHCMQGEQQRLTLAKEAATKACQEAKEAQSVAASERKRSAAYHHKGASAPTHGQNSPEQPQPTFNLINHTSADGSHVHAESNLKQPCKSRWYQYPTGQSPVLSGPQPFSFCYSLTHQSTCLQHSSLETADCSCTQT